MSLVVILAIGAMLGWGIGDFLIQKTIRVIGVLETLIWISLASTILLLPLVIADLAIISWRQFLEMALLGLVGFLCAWWHFKALEIGKLSVVETILSLELPLSILLGVLLFKEHLAGPQIILIALLFVGIILISFKFQDWRAKHYFEQGALLALSAAFLVALVNFGTAWQAKGSSPYLAIWLPWLVSLIFAWFFLKKPRRLMFISQGLKHWKLVLVMVIIDILAWLAFAAATARGELGITVAISESYVAVAVILGIIFNRERLRPWQYVGVVIAITSSLLIALIS